MKMIKLYQYDKDGVEVRTEIVDKIIISLGDKERIVIATSEKDSNKDKQLGLRIDTNTSNVFVAGIRSPKLSIKGINETILDDNGIFERGQGVETKAVDENSGYKASESLSSILSKIKQYELKERDRQSEMDKLEVLCIPISRYLRENYCPHDSIVITDDKIRLVRDEIGIPVDRNSEEEDELCGDPRVSMEEAIANIKNFLSKTK